MGEDVRGGEAAAVRLTEGVLLRDALDVADPKAWLSLDVGARHVSWYSPGHPPRWESAADRAMSSVLPGDARLALRLCHRDGRVRERAVLRASRHPGLLPLVVVRCADWAGPVRERARHVLREVLDARNAVRLAPVILLMGRRERGTFAVGLLREVLRGASGENLGPFLVSDDRTVRRFAFRIAVEERLLPPAELARTAAADGDAVVQGLCADAALAAVAAGTRGEDVIGTLLAARSPRVRSAGVTALRRAGQPERAERFLVDRSAVVRACARYVLRQHGTDPLPLYRSWCGGPGNHGGPEDHGGQEGRGEPADRGRPQTCGGPEGQCGTDDVRQGGPDVAALPPGAAIGLAECGSRADARLLWPLLTHPAAGVRARTVAGLRTLDVADADRLRPLLDDPAPGVVRETTRALLPSVERLPLDWLTERLDAGRPRHVRVAAFRLLYARDGVVRLRAAVALLDDPDGKLRGRAEQTVRQWYPSAEVRHGDPEVGALLDRGARLFGEQALRWRKRQAGLGC